MGLHKAVLAALPLLMLWGCATPQQEIVNQEDLLSAAGFVPRPVNTPARQEMLHSLPPNRFSQRAQGDHFVYVYPDPLVCGCVYFGNQAAYGRYREQMAQRHLVADEMLAADMNQDAAWNWGPWGPWGW